MGEACQESQEQPLEVGKGKKIDVSLEPTERNTARQNLDIHSPMNVTLWIVRQRICIFQVYGNLLQQQQETNTLDPGGHQGTRMSSHPFYIKNNEMTNCPHVSPQPCYTSGIKIHSVCSSNIKATFSQSLSNKLPLAT